MSGIGDWADLTTQRYLFHVKSSIDFTWYAVFGRDMDAINRVNWMRRVGVAYVKRTYTFVTPPTTWFCMGYSVDIAGGGREQCYLYVPETMFFAKVYDGAISGGNGAWGAYPVNDYNTLLMAGDPVSQLWKGSGSVSAYWAGVTLSDYEMMLAMGVW